MADTIKIDVEFTYDISTSIHFEQKTESMAVAA